jgi:hypothetical protein
MCVMEISLLCTVIRIDYRFLLPFLAVADGPPAVSVSVSAAASAVKELSILLFEAALLLTGASAACFFVAGSSKAPASFAIQAFVASALCTHMCERWGESGTSYTHTLRLDHH